MRYPSGQEGGSGGSPIYRPRRAAGLLAAAAILAALAPSACRRADRRPPRHVILFVGDGMSHATETAASRYLTGTDSGLVWQSWPDRAYAATWDVSAYDQNARREGRPAFDERYFEPRVGYDPRRGGTLPQPDPGATGEDGYFVHPRNHADSSGTGSMPKPRPRSGASLVPAPPVPPPGQETYTSGATDSAAAATALATGWKTDSGNVSWRRGDGPDARLETIAEAFRSATGGAIGVVTTSPFDDATPAAFVSHAVRRGLYYGDPRAHSRGIAEQIVLDTRPDVVIGGGHPRLVSEKRAGRYMALTLLKSRKAAKEYVVAESETGVDGAETLRAAADEAVRRGKKLFGLFGGPGGGLSTPIPEDSPGAPRVRRNGIEDPPLADATVAALRVLSMNRRGFFLMVEESAMDGGGHDNDFAQAVGGVSDLDRAVRAALEFVDRPGDGVDRSNTLILVTADHDTGFLRLNPEKPLGIGDLPREVEGEDDGGPPIVYPDGEVSFGTTGHANELVTVALTGEGAPALARFAGTWYPARILDNTQVNAIMRLALGLDATPHLTPVTVAPPAAPEAPGN